jgi:hypothetical protein
MEQSRSSQADGLQPGSYLEIHEKMGYSHAARITNQTTEYTERHGNEAVFFCVFRVFRGYKNKEG